MINEALKSALDNLKERTTNPFLGTLVLVWLFHNWKLIYTLMYFDSKLSLKDRLVTLEAHFSMPNATFHQNLLYVVWMTFCILAISYILLLVARVLTDLYDKIALPHITKWTDKSSIVLRSKYAELEEIVKQLELRVEEERLAKVAIQNERDKSDARIVELMTEKEIPSITPINESAINNENDVLSNYDRVASKLIADKNVKAFNELIDTIFNNNWIRIDDKIVKYLSRENLIIGTGTKSADRQKQNYDLTAEGKDFLKFWNSLDAEEEAV